jgi:hypothetical protein
MMDREVTASRSGEIIRPDVLVRGPLHHHVNEREHDRREAIFTLRLASALICLPRRNGTEMARPRTPSTAKPAQQRNTARDKMRMGYDRMRRDIKRTEAEQTKAAAAQTVKRGRK